MEYNMKYLFLSVLLFAAGCATDIPTPPQKVFNSVDRPYTISEIGDNHIIVVIFLAQARTKELAEKINKAEIESIGLQYRILTEKIDVIDGGFNVREEAEFLIPKDDLVPVITPKNNLLF